MLENLAMDTKQPKISVVIPAYNAGKTIGDCIESVLAQSFEFFEVIVVEEDGMNSRISPEISARTWGDDRYF